MMREIPTAIRAKYQLAMNMMETQQIAPRIERDLKPGFRVSKTLILLASCSDYRVLILTSDRT